MKNSYLMICHLSGKEALMKNAGDFWKCFLKKTPTPCSTMPPSTEYLKLMPTWHSLLGLSTFIWYITYINFSIIIQKISSTVASRILHGNPLWIFSHYSWTCNTWNYEERLYQSHLDVGCRAIQLIKSLCIWRKIRILQVLKI